jgi:hypothetical protein
VESKARARLVGALAISLLLAAAAATPAGAGSAPRAKLLSAAALQAGPTSFRDGVAGSRGSRALAAKSASWGGAVTARTGEAVTVYVSASYPLDSAITQHAADFVASLYHGPELQHASFYLAPLSEIARVCGSGDAGCVLTSQNLIVAPGTDLRDGTSVETILAHEYGHFVAMNRLNSPWSSLDWGPKRWASAANVCARTKAGTAFPGNEDAHYDLNPGEAWAETYRVLNYRHLALPGWARAPWNVDDSFAPNAATLDAARRDVLDPWQGPTALTWTGTLDQPAPAKKSSRKLPLAPGAPQIARKLTTPHDGVLAVSLDGAPAGATIALADASGRLLVAGAGGSLRYTLCGQRSVTLTVTAPAPGSLSATISLP